MSTLGKSCGSRVRFRLYLFCLRIAYSFSPSPLFFASFLLVPFLSAIGSCILSFRWVSKQASRQAGRQAAGRQARPHRHTPKIDSELVNARIGLSLPTFVLSQCVPYSDTVKYITCFVSSTWRIVVNASF